MSDSDKKKLLLGGVVATVAVVVAGYLFLLTPWLEAETELKNREDSKDKKQAQIRQFHLDKPKLDTWRQLALPLPKAAPGKDKKTGPEIGFVKEDAQFKTETKYLEFLESLAKAHDVFSGLPVKTNGASQAVKAGAPRRSIRLSYSP